MEFFIRGVALSFFSSNQFVREVLSSQVEEALKNNNGWCASIVTGVSYYNTILCYTMV